jgi:hypothetical protein
MAEEPILADAELKTPYAIVEPGHAAGLRSAAQGARDRKPAIILEFISYAEAEEYDAISIEVPNINEKIAGGVHGDIGTVDVIVNIIP